MEDGMSLPLASSNGIPKLEISQLGISVVAHISEKYFSHREGVMFIAHALTMMDKYLTVQSYLRNLVVVICVIHRTDAPASRPV
jgi:hypothetical protein